MQILHLFEIKEENSWCNSHGPLDNFLMKIKKQRKIHSDEENN